MNQHNHALGIHCQRGTGPATENGRDILGAEGQRPGPGIRIRGQLKFQRLIAAIEDQIQVVIGLVPADALAATVEAASQRVTSLPVEGIARRAKPANIRIAA